MDSNGYLVNNSGMRVQGYSDLILEPTSVGDIKFDRGDYMSSVEVIKADDNFKLLTTGKNHGLKTGNIVVLKSDSELSAPTKNGAPVQEPFFKQVRPIMFMQLVIIN